MKRTPGISKPATLALYHLLATHDLLHSYFTPVIGKHGVSIASWNVLNLLYGADGGTRPMHELSELMLVSRQNVTQLVDGLEKMSLVERRSCREDGRVKLVEITKAGRDVVERAQRAHFDTIKDVFSKLRDPELELLADYLLRVQERILELRAEKVRGDDAGPASGPREGTSPERAHRRRREPRRRSA
jgi:DNA-binding MarR family transcriptional regulator